MDRVKMVLCHGDYENVAYLEVEDGNKIAGILEDFFADFEHETDRVFYRYNDNTLHSILFYTEIEKDVIGKEYVRYRAVINDGKLVSN